MIEVFLFGIVLGLIPMTLAGLFVTAYLQYRPGSRNTTKPTVFRILIIHLKISSI
ncbi:putative cytochrome b6/f complex, subunit 5 [Rosa chinensis]|uniref:Putative cytochrome b6/f complex, subunit 5 n=1 Tax=Rosa chinensis TaxID=74649 RepID=A0A2P6RWC9_ROSCH|nr:putative cytochrome b6/f complex, subunit 5 [Rosa chinensis]